MWRLKLLIIAFFLNTACFAAPAVKPNNLQDINVALVLGGGGARALAQAGVMDVLEENKVPIDLIVGSSAGSIIGAISADNPSSHQLRKKVLPLRKWDLLDVDWSAGVRMFWNITGPVQGTALREFIDSNIHAKSFSELKIPLVVVTTDVNRGETFVIQSGPLSPALHASSAIPMLFAPVEINGRLLVDGGVASPLPVEVAKQYSPKITIAVDIGTTPNNGEVSSVAHLGYRSLHISYYQLSKLQAAQADIVIHPEIDKYSMFTDSNNQEMYRAGREAALKALPDILALLNQNKT